MVCDERNHRVQVFELSGKFVTKSGSKGVARMESLGIQRPQIVVSCDMNNSRIQLFDDLDYE